MTIFVNAVVISFHLLANNTVENLLKMNPDFKLPTGRRELKIGDSLRNNGTAFHGIKYDFKPSNEEFNESAIMEITPTNQVTVKYPQNENEGTTDFMYSGTMRQFPKEYFLMIDHVTGEVTLERLTANIQLKRTKVANSNNKSAKNQNNKKVEIEKDSPTSPELRTPSSAKKKTKKKQKTKNTTMADPKLMNKKYGLIPQHSPLHPSPSRTSPSEKNPIGNDYKSPSTPTSPEAGSSLRTPQSLDDDESSMTGFESKFSINLPELTNMPQQVNEFGLAIEDTIGTISDTSSDSSSDSDSDSGSSSSSSASSNKGAPARTNGYLNGYVSPTALKDQLLKGDLQLSETGSDSD